MALTIIDKLKEHACIYPHKKVFRFVDGETGIRQEITFSRLLFQTGEISRSLCALHLANKNVLLAYQDAEKFIPSFLACIKAGIVAIPVPVYKGRKYLNKLKNIILDSGAVCVLCANEHTGLLKSCIEAQPGEQPVTIISTDDLPVTPAGIPLPASEQNELAFIQYTSGSTGAPKGVMITNQQIMHNQKLITDAFGCNEHSVILSWLPFHHDMGLIGNLLHAIYAGCTCIVMNPVSFMQRPRRWLEAITQYKVTHSGGPNFAYDLCNEKISNAELSGLDLSSWRIAYNGAEPVKAATIKSFCERFKTVGFDAASFYPCYGLAEATLLVAGSKKRQPPVCIDIEAQADGSRNITVKDGRNASGKTIVSCGQVAHGMQVMLHTEKEQVTGELQEGEICIAGESVTEGYWKKNNDHLFYTIRGRQYLRTGDTGFFYKNELFILGRIKEQIIVRGRNIYPADMEQIAAACSDHIEPNGVAAFAVEEEGGSFALLVEIKRTSLQQADLQTLVRHIDTEVANTLGLKPYDIVLTTPRQIPRTTSGKLQRLACQAMYASKEIPAIATKRNQQPPAIHQNGQLLEAVKQKGDAHSIRQYMEATISEKLGVPVYDSVHQLNDLAAIGLDSIGAIEMVHKVNRDLQLNLDASVLFREHSLNDLVTIIERLLWLKNKKNTGKEITI